MKILAVKNKMKVRRAIPGIEKKVKIRFSFPDNKIAISGSELDEYITGKIVEAIDFGFAPEDALLLANEDFVLEYLSIREHTKKNNIAEVRARLIGTEGKARKTIQALTGSEIVIKGNKVGYISDAEHLDAVTQALISLMQGSKHANVFAYLEKQNSNMHIRDDDLGLKENVLKKQ